MRLKSSISMVATVALLAWSPALADAAEPTKTGGDDNLLFRVQFAGMTTLLANTNAEYLTNFTALPESPAFATQVVARIATLPRRFFSGSTTNDHGHELKPVFADLFRRGFTLELRGTRGAVSEFALAAKADAETIKRWESAWNAAATNWPKTSKFAVQHVGDRLFIAGSKTDPTSALAAIQKSAGTELETGAVLQGELASAFAPGPVQRSVYGGFERLKLTVTAADNTLKVRGAATYAHDLPKLGPPPVIPTNLVTEPTISFTLVRNPTHWLDIANPLRKFMPDPLPDVGFFWGGQTSPYQLFFALPFPSKDAFNNSFGPQLMSQLEPVIKFIDLGTISFDTNNAQIKAITLPFVDPKISVKTDGTNSYLLAEAFLQDQVSPGLSPALLERIMDRTNLLVYDWEFTQLRVDTWLRLGGLAMFASHHQANIASTDTLKWILAWQSATSLPLNTSTEITQTGPRELTLKRSGPLALTSIEIFWLANWLESQNFPAANFLVPAEQ